MRELVGVHGLGVESSSTEVRRAVLDGIDLSIGCGESVGVLGASGCGKTTLLLALLDLLPYGLEARGGELRFRGRLADRPTRRALRGRHIGWIPQEPAGALHPFLPIGRQLAEIIEIHRGASRGDAAREAVDWLDRLGVSEPRSASRRRPRELSGGERQRVLLALALAPGPDLVLADEPTSALDPPRQRLWLDLIESAHRARGGALLLVSHDPAVLAAACDRVVVIDRGKIIEEGPPRELFSRPGRSATADLARAAGRFAE